jgi:phosphatidylserine decarboxylase
MNEVSLSTPLRNYLIVSLINNFVENERVEYFGNIENKQMSFLAAPPVVVIIIFMA